MSKIRVEHASAFVIHYRRYQETSLLLELLTRDHGRVGTVAKGARRPRSPWRGVLQPFVPLSVSWLGRGELATLTQAETRGHVHRLHGSRLVSGLYLNELVYRLCGRHDPHPTLFAAYANAVSGLQGSGPYERTLRIFEKRLLEAIGYGLVLERTGDTDAPIEAFRTYAYIPEQGPVMLERPTDGDRGPYAAVTGATLLALANESLSTPVELAQAKRLMRSAIASYLGDRPLASREMFPESVG